MWLVDFLISVYKAVYDWFAPTYWVIKQYLNALPDLVANVIKMILRYYDLAVNYVSNAIVAYVNKYVDPVLDDIRVWLVGLQTTVTNITNAIGTVTSYVNQRITEIKNAIIAWATAKYDALISDIKELVNDILYTRIPALIANINSLLPFQTWLSNAASQLHINDIVNMLNSWNSTKSTILLFFANPLGFILGLFWQFALTFLAFVIGYAMGTTKYNLPVIPNWNNLTKR